MEINRYSPLPRALKITQLTAARMLYGHESPYEVAYMTPINLTTPESQEAFRTLLKAMPLGVAFRKVNGDHRYMRCTLDQQFIPPGPAKTEDVYDKNPFADEERVQLGSNTCRVFDMDARGWRSFRWTSVLSFETLKG
jgi:hypothetical protein